MSHSFVRLHSRTALISSHMPIVIELYAQVEVSFNNRANESDKKYNLHFVQLKSHTERQEMHASHTDT